MPALTDHRGTGGVRVVTTSFQPYTAEYRIQRFMFQLAEQQPAAGR